MNDKSPLAWPREWGSRVMSCKNRWMWESKHSISVTKMALDSDNIWDHTVLYLHPPKVSLYTQQSWYSIWRPWRESWLSSLTWASAHRGKWGQLTPWKMYKKIKKRKHAKKSSFLNILRSIRAGRWPHIYSDILQNAPFRSQIFKIFFASGGTEALTPLTKILQTPPPRCWLSVSAHR